MKGNWGIEDIHIYHDSIVANCLYETETRIGLRYRFDRLIETGDTIDTIISQLVACITAELPELEKET